MATSQSNQKKKADLKVVLIGSADVGKTCLVVRYTDDSFNSSTESTIGASFFLKQWGPYNIAIWDTAGEERFSGLSTFYCRDAGAAIMVYDPKSRASFLDLRSRFMPLLPTDNCLKVVVAAKMDLVTSDASREVSQQEAREFCREINNDLLEARGDDIQLPFFETSSKTGESVTETFEFIFEKCLSALSEEYRLRPRDTLRLHSAPPGGKEEAPGTQKRKCCSS